MIMIIKKRGTVRVWFCQTKILFSFAFFICFIVYVHLDFLFLRSRPCTESGATWFKKTKQNKKTWKRITTIIFTRDLSITYNAHGCMKWTKNKYCNTCKIQRRTSKINKSFLIEWARDYQHNSTVILGICRLCSTIRPSISR